MRQFYTIHPLLALLAFTLSQFGNIIAKIRLCVRKRNLASRAILARFPSMLWKVGVIYT